MSQFLVLFFSQGVCSDAASASSRLCQAAAPGSCETSALRLQAVKCSVEIIRRWRNASIYRHFQQSRHHFRVKNSKQVTLMQLLRG